MDRIPPLHGTGIPAACRKAAQPAAQPGTGNNNTSEAGLTIEAISAYPSIDCAVIISYTTRLDVARIRLVS